jgi:hypothetical protein
MDNIIGVSNSLNESKRSVTLTQKNIANNKVIFNNIMDRLDVAIVGVLNDLTVQTDLYNYRVDVNTNIDALLTLQETNNSVASSINSSMNSVTDISSYVNGVTAINITDNTNNMLNTVKNSSKHNSEATNKINNQLQPLSPKSQQIVTIIQSIISRLQSSAEASVLPDVQKEIPNLQSVSSAFSSISNDISSYVNDAKDANNMVKRVISNISPSVSNISNINADMKGLYTKVDSYIDLRRSNGIKNILSNFTGDITKSISGLGMEAIGQIKDNLDNVKDLSTIGQLGIPKIDAKLNIGGSLEDDVAKNKIVRINNDNPNMVKNMKADLETSSTLLSINKNDLDTSALTINKEYIIKNYDVHSDKDGRFLLARKREIYMREDTSFVMNTILEFKKLKDS